MKPGELVQWEVGRVRDTATREAYATWLESLHWDYFVTVTFRRPRVDGIRANDRVWSTLEACHVKRAFLATERFKWSRELHVHGLLSNYDGTWYPRMALPWDMWERCFKVYGRTTVEAINGPAAVTRYCSKYVVKGLSEYGFYGRPAFWDK
ncbi:unnamed protein product [marine sediment metagenome]|uniref:Uncharacterized protein n=1 Tax=marine sediment metagenome TaxID=412755 RepID=X1KSJ4_9ZZZZ